MKNKKNLLVVLLLLLFFQLKAQNNVQCINKAGFQYFCIKDTLKRSASDSIRFVVNPNLNETRPLIVFIQGSGNQPIIFSDQEECFSLVESIIPKDFLRKYNIALISKPGVPICAPFENASKVWASNRGDYEIFCKNAYLDYYVSSTLQVIDFLRSQSFVDNSRIFLLGHSEGGIVAAKLAAKFPEKISKLVFMASSIFDRQNQTIANFRKMTNLRIIEPQIAQLKIDSVYKSYEYLKEYVMNKEKYFKEGDLNYYLYRYAYSFNYDPALNYLLRFNKPIFVVYGSLDNHAYELDMLPLLFSRANNNNLSLKCYPSYDHHFFELKYNKLGELIQQEYKANTVFEDIEVWLISE